MQIFTHLMELNNNVMLLALLLWPIVVFFVFLKLLRERRAKHQLIKRLIYLCGLIAVLVPSLWVIISAYIYKYSIDTVIITIVWLMIETICVVSIPVFFYIRQWVANDDLYKKIKYPNNKDVREQYPNSKTLLFLNGGTIVLAVVMFAISVILALIPSIYEAIHFYLKYIFFISPWLLIICFIARWLLRCPACNLAIYDYGAKKNKNAIDVAFSVLFKKKFTCIRCGAVYEC